MCICSTGFRNLISNDCSEVLNPSFVNIMSPTGSFVFVLTLLSLFAGLVTAILIYKNRNHAVLRASSVLFSAYILSGIILLFVGVAVGMCMIAYIR